jgi:type II secretory pathway pseudopilin PulG
MTMIAGSPCLRPRQLNRLRAFTLVELMVAVTGGLFISVIVFAMARQGTRFYQQETRIAEATLGATIGMQRLRADIGRAGFMASTNISVDPNLCTQLNALDGFPLLQKLRSIQISQESDGLLLSNDDLLHGATTQIKPDRIQLAGAYQNADRFIAGYLPPDPGASGGNIAIPLQPNIGALARYRYSALDAAGQTALLASLFPPDRALRLVNQYGKVAYGIIVNAAPNGGLPVINLKSAPPIPLRGATNSVCEFAGVGVEVNVVNFLWYRIADLQHDPNYSGLFGQLYASAASPWDANRTELIREELNPATERPFTQTGGQVRVAPEIVAEYAVDLKFEVTYTSLPGTKPTLTSTTPATGDTPYTIAGLGTGDPQRVRSVRARLSVRSREADRAQTIPGGGLYRLGITPTIGVKAFARVRTLQSDIAIPNHF